jgi:hypothetical protein
MSSCSSQNDTLKKIAVDITIDDNNKNHHSNNNSHSLSRNNTIKPTNDNHHNNIKPCGVVDNIQLKNDKDNNISDSSVIDNYDSCSIITYIMYIVLILTTIFTYPNDWYSNVSYR